MDEKKSGYETHTVTTLIQCASLTPFRAYQMLAIEPRAGYGLPLHPAFLKVQRTERSEVKTKMRRKRNRLKRESLL